jgi:hypothetical protein
MKVATRTRAASFAVIALVIGLAGACTTGGHGHGASQVKIYDSNPSPLPAGVVSQCFQCDQISELGDEVSFAGTARKLSSATLTLGNWAWKSPTNTPYGDETGWSQDFTLNIYAVGAGHTVSTLLGHVTQSFHIPWRPDPDPVNCPVKDDAGSDYKYVSSVDGKCHNSLATQITFNLSSLNLTAPGSVVWSVQYDTQSYGPHPKGEDGPWNSLNVGEQVTGPTVGTDAESDTWFMNSATASNYCDGGTGGAGSFRRDSGCRSGDTLQISFSATN